MLQGHTDSVRSVAFSAKGNKLASGSLDASIRVWDATTGVLLRAIPNAHGSRVLRVHFSPMDSRKLASARYFNRAKQGDIVSGEMIGTVEGHIFAVRGDKFV